MKQRMLRQGDQTGRSPFGTNEYHFQAQRVGP